MPTLEQIIAVVGALVGWPALVALVIDILKYLRVVEDGTAGKWNLGFNLAAFVIVGIAIGFFPNIDIAGVDKILLEYVKLAAYIFALVVQILATRGFHALYVRTDFGSKYFSYQSEDSHLHDLSSGPDHILF